MARRPFAFVGAVCVVAPALAADVTVYGTIYGALLGDFAEGRQAPTVIPETAGEEENDTPTAFVTKDGDPAYNFRLEADLGVRAVLDERVAANILFTFDDRKQSRFYRYDLFGDAATGTWHLSEREENEYVYGSLEQVDIELADLFWETDVTVGGFDVRYGHGGYYNGLVNRIDPTSFVAYLDPFGVRFARHWGSGPDAASSTLELGVGLQRQPLAAASHRWRGVTVFAAVENIAYDLKSLWDTHQARALPKAWRYYYWREGELAAEPVTSLDPPLQSYHFGVEMSWQRPWWDVYSVGAYHIYPDAAAIARDPSGGTLLQFYPDFGVRILPPRLWLRGAVLYELWRANYDGTFGDAINTNDYLLLYGEPQFFFTETLFVGVGGRYVNPSRRAADDPKTDVRENQTLSVALVPHVSYAPAGGVKIDISYEYSQWDPTYDIVGTALPEDRAHNLKVEIRAGF